MTSRKKSALLTFLAWIKEKGRETMSKLILSIDDSQVIKLSVKEILDRQGIDSRHALNGQEAIDLMGLMEQEGKRVSLILCDLNMPIKNGIEFLSWIKGHEKFKLIPVIMFTTETEIALMQDAKKIGASGWIIKPFDEDLLLDIIRKFAR
jgi:two-component system chemotaxis response regulator CheY